MVTIPRLHLPMRHPTEVIPHLGAANQYRDGRSAKLIAETWFTANDLPDAVRRTLASKPRFARAELIDAFLERSIELGDGFRPSQADALAVLGLEGELAVMAVEGKVNESFGPLVSEWLTDASEAKKRRLANLTRTLGLDHQKGVTQSLRYQLLHRTASAIYEAHRYRARVAVMMVHSFDEQHAGLSDFQWFAAAINLPNAGPMCLAGPVNCEGVSLYLGWAADRSSTRVIPPQKPSLLDHVSITVSDIGTAERFYDAVMGALDVAKIGSSETWIGYGERCNAFHADRTYLSLRLGSRPEHAPGRHWCFKAAHRQAVDTFWRAGLGAGGSDAGGPGLRTDYHPNYYAAYLSDPDGNLIEAVCHALP